MLDIKKFGEITQINMSREIDGKPAFWVSAYYVDGLLIDTGCSYTAEELYGFLADMEVQCVVNTHYHEDHIGCNYLIKESITANIFAHRIAIPLINQVPSLYPYQERVWGYPQPVEVLPIPDNIRTQYYTFEIIDTPGHCNGHISLFEPDMGWCFTGDLFASETPRVARPEENIKGIIKSMKILLNLRGSKLILFTSGGRVVENGKQALAECIEYLNDLTIEVNNLYKEGLATSTIRDRIFGKESSRAERTNGQFSSENLIRSILSS